MSSDPFAIYLPLISEQRERANEKTVLGARVCVLFAHFVSFSFFPSLSANAASYALRLCLERYNIELHRKTSVRTTARTHIEMKGGVAE